MNSMLEKMRRAVEEAVRILQSRKTANVLKTTEEASYIEHDNSGMFVTKPDTTSKLTVSNREDDQTNYIFKRAKHTVERFHEGASNVTQVYEFRESTAQGKKVFGVFGTDSKKVIWKRLKVEPKPGKIRLDDGRYFFVHKKEVSGEVFESTKHAGSYLACRDRVLFLKNSAKFPGDDPEVSFTVTVGTDDTVRLDDTVDSGFFGSSLLVQQQLYSGSAEQLQQQQQQQQQQCADLVNSEQIVHSSQSSQTHHSSWINRKMSLFGCCGSATRV